MSITTNMSLVLPDVSVTPGPLWAAELNAALQLIDAHDHTSGKGVKITTAALNINADLSFNSYAVRSAQLVELKNYGSTPSDPGVVYRNGSNLYYNNGAGAAIQLTTGTSVNAPGSGVISASVISSYPYAVVLGDAQKILVIDSSAARTVNLPAATTAMFFMIKDGVGSALTNNISIVPNGTDLIDGSNSTYKIEANFGCLGLVSDGITKWYVV